MKTAKLFKIGRSQAVRLPKAFRFEGKEVYIKRVENGVLLMPIGIQERLKLWQTWYDNLPLVEEQLECNQPMNVDERDWAKWI
jgi:antitoxin VapB